MENSEVKSKLQNGMEEKGRPSYWAKTATNDFQRNLEISFPFRIFAFSNFISCHYITFPLISINSLISHFLSWNEISRFHWKSCNEVFAHFDALPAFPFLFIGFTSFSVFPISFHVIIFPSLYFHFTSFSNFKISFIFMKWNSLFHERKWNEKFPFMKKKVKGNQVRNQEMKVKE